MGGMKFPPLGVVVEPMQDPFDSGEESVEEGGESFMEKGSQAVSLAGRCVIQPVCFSRPRCYHRESNDRK